MAYLKASLLGGIFLAATAIAAPLTQYMDGVGYRRQIPRGTPRPPASPLRMAAEAAAQRKCEALFGPGSRISSKFPPHFSEASAADDDRAPSVLEFAGVF